METIGLRLYGVKDLRLERFPLPEPGPDEILADVRSNGICMSDHKAALQGAGHKRVPDNVATHPILLGHEFCGTVLKVGARWAGRFKPGQKYSIQPALNLPGREHEAPGYSFPFIGGQATHVLIPKEVLEMDCLLPYDGEAYYQASLSETYSCVIGAFNSTYHSRPGDYRHINGIAAGGRMALLAGAGPMGIAAIDYAVHGDRKPRLLVVTDIDQARLDRLARLIPPAQAAREGVDLRYVNTAKSNAVELLQSLADGQGYDDVFVFAPVPALVEQASSILGFNGCLNFFAGPGNRDFWAKMNFYDVHYMGHHVVGSSGGNTDDMRDALRLMAAGRIRPAALITHVGGLDSAAAATLDLPNIPGGRKMIYTQISMPLTAIADFAELGRTDPLLAELGRLVRKHDDLWSEEAEKYLIAHGRPIADAVK